MKKLFATLLASATLLGPAVQASPGTGEDHRELWATLQEVGVTTIYNHKIHCAKGLDGAYYPYAALLVVCQDKMTTHLKEHSWTENDFDTLRHEAHHVVQDCVVGKVGDGKTSPMFEEEELITFLSNSSYTKPELQQLYSYLKGKGLSDFVIQEEMEAYIVAEDISAKSITKKLIEFCGT